jgi:hypothetical protein
MYTRHSAYGGGAARAAYYGAADGLPPCGGAMAHCITAAGPVQHNARDTPYGDEDAAARSAYT